MCGSVSCFDLLQHAELLLVSSAAIVSVIFTILARCPCYACNLVLHPCCRWWRRVGPAWWPQAILTAESWWVGWNVG